MFRNNQCAMKGVYVLILRLDAETEIRIGKIGNIPFLKGYYAYIGSAQGSGGFRRVTRHFDVASGKNRTKRWHIDHLLPHSAVEYAVLLPACEDIECAVERTIGQSLCEIPGFGSTDCGCSTHLFFAEKDPRDIIIRAGSRFIENESIIINPHM